MSRYVSEYDVGLNPIVNESQLDKAIATIDAKLRKVRSGAHEALATQLQSLLRTTMRVARLPSPTKAMEYISNATQGGYTFAQRRVITSGVGKAMTEIRGATQAEAAANRAAAQEQSRAVKMQKQREREQSRLDRWFQTSRGSSPIQEVQNMVLSQIENNTAAENMAKAKSAAIFAKKQEQFDIGRRALLREGLTLRSQGGTEKQLETWQNKVAKFADSWQMWAKQDKKNANTLNTFLSRAKNPNATDLEKIKGGSGLLARLLGSSLFAKGLTAAAGIKLVQKAYDYATKTAGIARESAANPLYSRAEQLRAARLSGVDESVILKNQQDVQSFGMRAMMGEVSDDEWLAMSVLGGDVYRAFMSGDYARVDRAVESATKNMGATQARYWTGKLGMDHIVGRRAVDSYTRPFVENASEFRGRQEQFQSVYGLDTEMRKSVYEDTVSGGLRAAAGGVDWGLDWLQSKTRGIPMVQSVSQMQSGAVQINIENKFDSDDPNVARKITDQLSRELNGFKWDDLQQVQQYNAGRAR